jgi:hypothetical protein
VDCGYVYQVSPNLHPIPQFSESELGDNGRVEERKKGREEGRETGKERGRERWGKETGRKRERKERK